MIDNAPRQSAPERQQEERHDRHEATGCLLRLYWMLLGNALVVLFAYRIAEREGMITPLDAVFWLGAASLVIVRYVDIRFLAGKTAEGKPATMKHWRRYSLHVLVLSAVLWLAVHGLGYFTANGP